MNKGRVLALDVGKRRVGVAISDEHQVAVSPFCVLSYRGVGTLARRIKEIVEEQDVVAVVVGVPRRTDGKTADMEIFVRRIIEALRNVLPCPVEEFVEFYTTTIAQRLLGKRSQKGDTDMKAAQIILADYLRHLQIRPNQEE